VLADLCGDAAGGGRVDGRAVDEDAAGLGGWFGELRGEDFAEDALDVLWFGKGGDDVVLIIC
jgi:hypothetical protein